MTDNIKIEELRLETKKNGLEDDLSVLSEKTVSSIKSVLGEAVTVNVAVINGFYSKILVLLSKRGELMKLYWFLVLCSLCIWAIVSVLFPEPSWWSIFSSDRSTHTPLIEQLSINKVFSIMILYLGLAYLLHRKFQRGR